MTNETVPIGTLPEPGVVPTSMFAQVIRSERTGDPRDAFVVEEIDVPVPGPNDVLIAVMAAGVNFNNVWAAKGVPIDVIKVRQKGGDTRDYHVGGSDASGIVWAVGEILSDKNGAGPIDLGGRRASVERDGTVDTPPPPTGGVATPGDGTAADPEPKVREFRPPPIVGDDDLFDPLADEPTTPVRERHVPRGEDSLDGGVRSVVHDHVSVLIEIDLSLEDLAVRRVADGHEDAVDGHLGGL